MTRTAIFHLCCSLWMLMVPETNALHPRRPASKLVMLAAAANNNVPGKDTIFGNHPHGENVLLDNKNNNNGEETSGIVHGVPNELLLGLRGGGGMGTTILQGMIRNPILVLLMIASSVLSVYQNSLKYSKQLQSAVQGFIVVYVFLGLLEWQTRKKEQAENAMVDDDDIVPSPASAET